MSARLPDSYFDHMYSGGDDPWKLATRWYEERKYALTMGVLPLRRYRHAFEPGCSIGTLTQLLARRCDHVTSVDIAEVALRSADARLQAAGCREQVTLARSSLDEPWPVGPFDLLVLSEVAYYLDAELLEAVLARECPKLAPDATVVSAHWRHDVADYPLSGEAATEIIGATPGLTQLGIYRDHDVVIAVFDTGSGTSVAAREEIPGVG